ncbi:MAG: endonuclease/exonuclease/phosphatase family protein [Spirochaetaceae bacterium]|nr:endonuclease/exonuclease/phosphatase family protein [Spirochaetaceae bacterium]
MGILTTASIIFLIAIPLAGKPSTVKLQAEEPARQSLPAVESPSTAKAAKTVRIATWNLRDCAANDKSGARISFHDSIAEAIRDAGIGIIVLEEVQVDSKKGGDIALLSVALAKADWSMPYVCSIDPKGEDDLAIFSRYPIHTSGQVLAPEGKDPWPRPGIFASIDIDGTRLDVFGFHFKAMSDANSEAARKAQAAAMADQLEVRYGSGLSAAAIVLAGDFNTTNAGDFSSKGSTLSILSLKDDKNPDNDFLDANYRFLPKEPTFSNSRNKSVLDHIIVSKVLARSMDSSSVKVLMPPPGPEGIPVSDHRIVIADLRLP